ncbi:PE-PPE domain-containing protein [Mycobacterium sp. IS-1496]|uniref:PE-PPE domain-containing protein n=1 Tax=Mycobacterium sp. IS-1496 TaxID=1772284 RepID=UPI0009EB0615|nr:PE-PPE domain-containing protein [Mycobacterium sp. IS-1496]
MKGALKVATATASFAIATAVPASADTALYVGGTGWPGTPTQSQMTWLRNDVYAGRDDTLVGVGYPASPILMNESVAMGARELGGAVTTTTGRKSLVGVSQGSLVVHEEERRIMTLPENQRPAKNDVRFVYIGDPARPSGGIANWVPEGVRVPGIGISRPAPLVETPYETVYVTREYDGIADFPDRPLNLLSTANAVMGVVYLHPNYGVDLTDVPKGNITETTNTKGGKTTSYLVPTKELPLTKPLRQLGVDRRIVDEVDRHLRPVVDSGYKRNDTKRNTVSGADEPTASQRDGARSDDAADGRDGVDAFAGQPPVVKSAGGS